MVTQDSCVGCGKPNVYTDDGLCIDCAAKKENKKATHVPNPFSIPDRTELRKFLARLNDEAEDLSQEDTCISVRPFTYGTDGNVDWVKFLDHVVWDSETGVSKSQIHSFLAHETKLYLESLHKINPEVLFKDIPPYELDEEPSKRSFLPNLPGGIIEDAGRRGLQGEDSQKEQPDETQSTP